MEVQGPSTMANHHGWSEGPKGRVLSKRLIQLCNDRSSQLLTGLQVIASKLAAGEVPQCVYLNQNLTEVYQELTASGGKEFAFVAPWTFSLLSSRRPGPSGGTIWVRSNPAASQTSNQPAGATSSQAPQHTWDVEGQWLVVKQAGEHFKTRDITDSAAKYLLGEKANCYTLAFHPYKPQDLPNEQQTTEGTMCIRSSIDPTALIRVTADAQVVRGKKNEKVRIFCCQHVCIWHVSPSACTRRAPKQTVDKRTRSTTAASPSLPQLPAVNATAQTKSSRLQTANLGYKHASILATTNQVEELVSVLQHSWQFIGKLFDLKDGYGRSLLSLLCTEVRRWPPFDEQDVDPAPWGIKLQLYNILLSCTEPGATVTLRNSHINPAPELLLALYSSENNHKARPLYQLMYAAKDADSMPFLDTCLQHLRFISPEQRLEHVLLAMSNQAWQPYHNAVKQHNTDALTKIIEAIIDALVEVEELPQPATSPRRDDTPPSSKRQRSMSPNIDHITGTIRNIFHHPASKFYRNGDLLEDTLASVLSKRYGRDITPNDLKLQTASKEVPAGQPAVASGAAITSHQVGVGIVEQPAVAAVAGPSQRGVLSTMHNEISCVSTALLPQTVPLTMQQAAEFGQRQHETRLQQLIPNAQPYKPGQAVPPCSHAWTQFIQSPGLSGATMHYPQQLAGRPTSTVMPSQVEPPQQLSLQELLQQCHAAVPALHAQNSNTTQPLPTQTTYTLPDAVMHHSTPCRARWCGEPSTTHIWPEPSAFLSDQTGHMKPTDLHSNDFLVVPPHQQAATQSLLLRSGSTLTFHSNCHMQQQMDQQDQEESFEELPSEMLSLLHELQSADTPTPVLPLHEASMLLGNSEHLGLPSTPKQLKHQNQLSLSIRPPVSQKILQQ